MNLIETTLENLKKRRQKILDGGINCIPSPFVRFRSEFPGVEQSLYCIVSSFTKGAKSQFSSFVFVYNTLLYAYYHPETNVKVKILYFPLEETPERIIERFMSYLLYTLSKGKIRISPKDLRSTLDACPEEILSILETEEYQNLLKYFEDNVIFNTEDCNPTGIYYSCKRYAEANGTVHYKKSVYKDEFGILHETDKAFDYYEPNNQNEYRIVVIDTMNLLDSEKGMNKKQTIDKMSEYCAKYLRNRYGFTVVAIQQQSTENESVDSIRSSNIRPSKAGLADSKYSANDADIMIGLFSPAKFNLPQYMGYDITKFKDNIRFAEIVTNRNGEMGGIIALYFDGAVCTFRELPKPDNREELNKIYKYIQSFKEEKPKISMFIKSIFKFKKYGK